MRRFSFFGWLAAGSVCDYAFCLVIAAIPFGTYGEETSFYLASLQLSVLCVPPWAVHTIGLPALFKLPRPRNGWDKTAAYIA